MRVFFLASLFLGWFAIPSSNELEIYFINTGQSDSTLLISPTGETFLFDCGSNGEGAGVVVPLLNSLNINQLDYSSASHYHADHLGGFDEIWDAGIASTICYDRGNINEPTTASYSDYKSRYNSVRQTIQPGQIVNLGGGVTVKCMVVDGRLSNGTVIDISGSSQLENSASIGFLVEYGDFQMWMGGDLTGGGNGTTNVESTLGPLVGDVDVYQANHHGSRTSSNSDWIANLKPEFTVIPCGTNNPYGYPKQEVINRINTTNKLNPIWSLTEGTGSANGYTSANGTIHIKTDGSRYIVTTESDLSFTSLVDEQNSQTLAPQDLVIAEFQHNPAVCSDSYGEWVEITSTQNNVNLKNLRIRDAGTDSLVIGPALILDQGEEVVLAADGVFSRNGGHFPELVWPANSFNLNASDTIWLEYSNMTIDRIDYNTNWGGNGTSAERIDLLGPSAITNFTLAVTPFGFGDFGTPGADNDADNTNWGNSGDLSIQALNPPVRGQILSMNWDAPREYNQRYQGFISLGNNIGYSLNGTNIPANQDQAYYFTYLRPGFNGVVPLAENMTVNIRVPNRASLYRRWIYACFYTFEIINNNINVRKVSPSLPMLIN